MSRAPNLVLASLALLVVACARPDTAALRGNASILAEAPPTARILTYASNPHEFVDPARVAESAGHHLMLNVFEGLYVYNRGDGPPVPAMATHHEVSPDGRTYTFHLREGITWSDGVPITAHDFVWSWRRVLDPQTASKSAQLLWFIRGAQAFHEGASRDPSTVAVRALDDRTLEVGLVQPTPFFDQLVCEMPYAPTPRHVVERWGLQWTRPAHIVSNGPFLLAEDVARVRTVLRRNPRYFDINSVFLNEIRLLMTEDEQTAFDWYEVGKTQWQGDVALPMAKVPALMTSGRVDFRTDPKLCSYYFSVRVDRPPLDDPRVRKAISLAIDRERMAMHVLRGGQPVAANAVPDLFEISHGYKTLQPDALDVARARRLLAEAGHPRGLGLPPIVISLNSGEGHRLIAEVMQRNLQDNLGIRVEIHQMEWGTLLKRMLAGDFQIGRSSWCADYPDPLTFLEVFHSSSAANYSGYASAAFDATVAAIRAEPDMARRNALIRQAEELLDADMPFLPMYHYTGSTLVKPYVLGYERHMQDKHPLKYVRWATHDEMARIRSGLPVRLPPFAVAAPTRTEGAP